MKAETDHFSLARKVLPPRSVGLLDTTSAEIAQAHNSGYIERRPIDSLARIYYLLGSEEKPLEAGKLTRVAQRHAHFQALFNHSAPLLALLAMPKETQSICEMPVTMLPLPISKDRILATFDPIASSPEEYLKEMAEFIVDNAGKIRKLTTDSVGLQRPRKG